MGFNLHAAIIRLLALLPALTLHEFAHAYYATQAGDSTPSQAGRVTLNPLAHLDPIGTLAILFLPIGWAKPVPVNPMNFKNPGRDDIIVSAAGPLSNIFQAVFWAIIIRILSLTAPGVIWNSEGSATVVSGFLSFMILLNFALAIFNMIPLGPLDGHHIVQNSLSYPQSEQYRRFNRQYGMVALIGVLIIGSMTGILSWLIVVPAVIAGRLLSGINILQAIIESGIW